MYHPLLTSLWRLARLRGTTGQVHTLQQAPWSKAQEQQEEQMGEVQHQLPELTWDAPRCTQQLSVLGMMPTTTVCESLEVGSVGEWCLTVLQ